MAIIKCKMCGGDLDISAGVTVAECEYCGSVQTVPTVDHEKKLTLFGRANRLRLACEFDKAAGVYESIVAEFPEEAEAYWGLVLCRYGIEYVDDPQSGTKIPTCHRSSFDSIMEDSDFEQTLENADVVARKVYREEAKVIEELRKGILEVSSKEEPYDIFICYKETDEKGDRTIDSVIAQDVYDALIEKGYRVFFSRISLEDKLGTEYEPYIFAALNSAKVMLVFGTDYEYYNAVWVKNEWSRFLALIATGQKKTLIPCYKSIDVYDMPKEFAKLQAQDMGKVGAVQDLLRGIGKIIQSLNGKSQAPDIKGQVETQLKQQANAQANNLVRLGILSLNSGNTQKGVQQFEEAIKIDGNHVGAYLGLIRGLERGKRDPYYAELKSFSMQEITTWLKANPAMLEEKHTNLLVNLVWDTHSPELIKAVLDAGQTPTNNLCLYYAIISDDAYELVEMLLDHGADPNKKYTINYSNGNQEIYIPIVTAVMEDKMDVCKLLIKFGSTANYIMEIILAYSEWEHPRWHQSLLDYAVRNKGFEWVEFLLNNGADPNIPRRFFNQHDVEMESYSILSDAIIDSKNIEVLRILVKAGASPNFTGRRIIYEQRRGYHGAYAAEIGNKVCSPLSDALIEGTQEMVKFLIEAGADPRVRYSHFDENDGYNMSRNVDCPVLALAIQKEKLEEIKMLIDAGATFEDTYKFERDYGHEIKLSGLLRDAPFKIKNSTWDYIKQLDPGRKSKGMFSWLFGS